MTEDIRKTIAKWLREEGITWQTIDDPNADFNFSCNYPPGQNDHINVVKPKDKEDVIVIITGVAPTGEHPKLIRKAKKPVRERFSWDLKYEFLRMFLEFNIHESDDYIIDHVEISRPVFYQNITKEYFMERLKQVHFGKLMFRFKLFETFGMPSETNVAETKTPMYG
jgi:hypothetical protein